MEESTPGGPPDREGRLARLRARQQARSDERFAERFSEQFSRHWAAVRTERREAPPRINPGQSDFSPARVPYGVDLAAAWAWRFLVIVAATYLVAQALDYLLVVVMPVVIALFIAALVAPLVDALSRAAPRGVATLVVVVGLIAVIALMITFVTRQVVNGAPDLTQQVVDGLDRIREWLKDGPLHATDKQIDDAIEGMQQLVSTSNDELLARVNEVGAAVGHIVAGIFIVLFSTYFFLADGDRIWAWVVRVFPRAARAQVDSSGRVAWASLTQFVRATVLVALTDALGVALWALVLGVPFVGAIGVLVFLGAFVPMVGAFVSGTVAVLVALVSHGPVVALLMLAGVVAVQQIEAHVLQPFLMGRFVSVHPLGIILAVAIGVLVAGIPGALVAVPLAATVNAVATHLASGREPSDEDVPLGEPPGEQGT